MMLYYIDAHTHMDNNRFNKDRRKVIERAWKNSVLGIVNAGSDQATSNALIELCDSVDNMWTAVGIHPHKAGQYINDDLNWLRDLARHPLVVAIGEMGLDFHYDFSPREQQRQVFERLMALAVEVDLPAVVHAREADEDAFIMLEQLPGDHPVLLHCFAGDVELMHEAVDRGYYLSLGGVITFNKAKEAQEVAAEVPLENLMLETDAPYLTPHPYRGKRNEPGRIPIIAQQVAKLRGIELETVAKATAAAAERFYQINLKLPE